MNGADLLLIAFDDADDDVVEFFGFIGADDGFEVRVADAGIVCQKDICTACDDRNGSAEQFGVTFRSR